MKNFTQKCKELFLFRKLVMLVLVLVMALASSELFAQTNKGKDFWLAETPNLVNGNFAISVANPGLVAVNITITNPIREAVTATINPGALQTFTFSTETNNIQGSGTYTNNVYHVTSNQDVVVYDFTPLVSQYSNDAALILPTNSLGKKYRPGSYINSLGNSQGSFFGVLATQAATNVKTYNRLGALVDNVTINQGQYFQRNNGSNVASDITGWYIETDKPAAVFSGSTCTSIGNSTGACDHIDEQVLPLESMASAYIASPSNSRPIGCTSCAPDVFRYVATEDNTIITTSPSVGGGTINKGQFVEISTSTPHIVSSNGKPFYGYQYLVSQDAGNPRAGIGDPAMLGMPPVDQFQFDYIFLIPNTFPSNFINVVAPTGTVFTMDGSIIPSNCIPVGTLGGITYCTYTLSVSFGVHRISADKQFGLSISGFGPYASYAYLGGVGLQPINAGCNTGGPYQLNTCNIRSIQLNGIATCSDGSVPTKIQWSSTDGVVFSDPTIANPTASTPGYGTFNICLTVTCGDVSVQCCSQITVTEPVGGCNKPPVAVCQPLVLPAGANCDATALAAAFDGGSTDADAGDVLSFSVSPAGPYAKGVTNVTFTVTDSKGASSSCTTTVTVVDNQPPVINCQPDITINNDPNACGASVTYTRPTATDNCSGSAFNFFNAGEPNNWGSEDYLQLYTSGTWNDLPNMGGLRFIVELNTLNTTPIAGYSLIGTFAGHTYFISTSTNNWTGARAQALSVGGDLASINTYAEDMFLAAYGGSTWVGGYQDHSDPNYVEPGNASQNFGGWKWVDGTQLGAGQIGLTMLAGFPSGSLFPIGTTVVTWQAKDESGNTSTCSFNVTVIDNQLPVLVGVPANTTVQCSAVPAPAQVTATDNCSAAPVSLTENVTPGNCPGNYTITRTWATADPSGNTAIATQVITVIDNTRPVFSSIPASTILAECDAVPVAPIITASDNCDASPAFTYNEVRTDGISPNDYILTRTWTATDACNNVSVVSQVVTVQDTKAPVLTLPADINVTNDAGICGAAVSYEATATDNCSPVAITYSTPSGFVFPVGSTVVTVTAKDLSGNTSIANFTVTVVDNEAPVAKCKPITITLVNGTASITVADLNDNSTDNCGIASVTISKNTFNCSEIGANTVTLSVTDIYHHVSTCTAIVTVIGEIPTCTVASIPTNTVYTGGVSTNLYLGYGAQSTTLKVTPAANGAPYTYAWSGDAINMLSSTTSGEPVFTPTAAGTYTFTVVTTNVYGCTTSCSITICVTDVKVYNYKDDHDNDDYDDHDGDKHQGENSSSKDKHDGDKHEGDDHEDDDDKKVYICHNGTDHDDHDNHGGPKTLSVSIHSVAEHLREHPLDRLGSCNQQPCSAYTDLVKPLIDCPKAITVNCNSVTAPSATGTATAIDNYSTATVTYSDATVGNKITRTWKATDVAGNFSTCTQTITVGVFFTANISSIPTSNVKTGGVSTNLYLGYGAQSTTLKVGSTPSNGAPYTYAWSGTNSNNLNNTNSAAPVFTPTAAGVYSFAVTITNKYGCTFVSNISICVKDIRVPGTNGSKVYVCHTPKSKNAVASTIAVAINQVSSHISNNSCGSKGHDRLGSCDQQPCAGPSDDNTVGTTVSGYAKDGVSSLEASTEELKVTVMPNPSITHFTIKLESKYQTPVELRVMDVRGRVVDAKSKIGSNSAIQIGHNYISGTYFAEFIQGTQHKVVQLIKGKG